MVLVFVMDVWGMGVGWWGGRGGRPDMSALQSRMASAQNREREFEFEPFRKGGVASCSMTVVSWCQRTKGV